MNDDCLYIQGDGQFIPRWSPSRAIKGEQPYPWLSYRVHLSANFLSSSPPVSVDDLKEHLRIDLTDTSEDSYLAGLLAAATGYVQDIANRPIAQSTLSVNYASFPPSGQPLVLPVGDTKAGTLGTTTIVYPNTGGTTTSLSTSGFTPPIQKVTTPRGSYVYPTSGDWPTDYDYSSHQAISLDATVAVDNNDSASSQLSVAIKMIAAYWYNAREAVVECTPSTLPLAFTALVANCTSFNLRGI